MSSSGLVPIVAGVIVGITLLLAGIAKLRSRTWPVLALEMGTPRPVVIGLPAVEAVVGLALILRVGVPYVPWIAVALFGVFTVVVLSRYLRGSNIPCNCFGGNGPITKWTIARNIGLVALAVLATL